MIVSWAYGKKYLLTNALLVTYIISTICAILLVYLTPDADYLQKTQYQPLFYLTLILLIVFNGFKHFKSKNLLQNVNEAEVLRLAEITSWVFFPVVLLLLYNDYNVLSSVDLSSYRTEGDYYSTGLFRGGIVLSLFIYISELFFVPQFLFFYLLTKTDVNKKLMFRLLLASFSFVFMTLLFAGRDGIVYWAMNSIVFYLIFKNKYSSKTKRQIKNGGIIVGIILAIPLLAISAARFFISGSTSFSESVAPLFSYGGQSPHVFCQSFYVKEEDVTGYDIKNMSNALKESLGLYLGWTFGTFVKTFVWTFGKWGAILMAIFFYIGTRLAVQMNNKKHDIWSFFLVLMLFQIPFWGVFYYRQGMNNMDIVHALFAIVCVFMYLHQKKLT